LDELPDDAVRQAFLEDFLRISPEGAFFAAKLLGKPRLVKAWGVMHPNQSFRTNIELVQRMSDDITKEPIFETWIRLRPEKLPAWKHWDGSYYSLGDPVRDIWGPGRVSHSGEWNTLMSEIRALGVEVVERPNAMAYTPNWVKNTPGQLILDPDASITALRHEHRHIIDDFSGGNWRGFEGGMDLNFRITTEYNGYKLEMEAMRAIGREDAISTLKQFFLNEVNGLRTGYTISPDPSVVTLIDELINF
jgi:hypothetical protein